MLTGLNSLEMSSLSGNLSGNDSGWSFSGNILRLFGGPELNVEWMAQVWGNSTVGSVSSSSSLSGSVNLDVSDDQGFNIEGLGLQIS